MSCPDLENVQTILDLPGLNLYLLFLRLGPNKHFLVRDLCHDQNLQHFYVITSVLQ